VLIPFATRLLTARGNGAIGLHALRFGFYALLQVLTSGLLLAMAHHVTARGLRAEVAPPPDETAGDWPTYGLLLGFAASIPIFFLVKYAWVLWIAVPPPMGHFHRRRIRRLRNAEETSNRRS
jgi:hypothetical protein